MRGRAVLFITAVAVALVAASSVTLADNINCEVGTPCLGSLTADTMTGTPQADDMSGLGGQDTMLARGGPDILEGGGGNDSLSGEKGNDTYSFSIRWGSDRIPVDGEEVGMGTKDALDFSSLILEPLDVDLVSSANRDEVYSVFSGAGVLNFPATVEIEDVTGGQARDVVRGTDGTNDLSGEGGNDSLYGRDGEDVLTGGSGADALIGGAGDDVALNGGMGADTVYGDNPEVPTEAGNDTIDVKDGLANDTVDCGPGTGDTVFFDEGDVVVNCENQNPPQQ